MKKFFIELMIFSLCAIIGYFYGAFENKNSHNLFTESKVDYFKNKSNYEEGVSKSFLQFIQNNPIDKYFKEYLNNPNSSPNYLEDRVNYSNAWLDEIEFTTEKLKVFLDKEHYNNLVKTNTLWKEYIQTDYIFDNDMYLPGRRNNFYQDVDGNIIGGSIYSDIITGEREAKIVERAKEILFILYEFTNFVEFNFNPNN